MTATKKKSVTDKMKEFGFFTQDIQPSNDRVLIRRLPQEAIGLVVIPEISKQKVFRGIVLRVGPGKIFLNEETQRHERRPVELTPGDLVYFGQWNDYEQFDDKDLIIITEGDIFVKERSPVLAQ